LLERSLQVTAFSGRGMVYGVQNGDVQHEGNRSVDFEDPVWQSSKATVQDETRVERMGQATVAKIWDPDGTYRPD
jgi:hypothetical protein